MPWFGGVWLYALIFFGKMIEISFDTLRVVFVGKGRTLYGVMCGLCQVVLWILLVNIVLTGISEDPLKAVVYCAASAAGIFAGSRIERWMAVGVTSMHIVVPKEDGETVGMKLKDSGFGVTILMGLSVDGTRRAVLLVQLRRRRVTEATRLARELCPEAIVSVSDLRGLSGGFLR